MVADLVITNGVNAIYTIYENNGNMLTQYTDVLVTGYRYERVVVPNQMVNYSTVEQRIGTWIDGKPLYQKTVEITPSSSTYTVVHYQHSIQNAKQICGYFAFLLFTSGTCQMIPSVQLSGSSLPSSLAAWVYVTTTDVQMSFGYDRSSEKVCITIQYTKTTD